MSRNRFTEEFKHDAVAQVVDPRYLRQLLLKEYLSALSLGSFGAGRRGGLCQKWLKQAVDAVDFKLINFTGQLTLKEGNHAFIFADDRSKGCSWIGFNLVWHRHQCRHEWKKLWL
ncbi:MAG: hypothetical protein ACI92A_000887 [Candidatus Paceibacteria bacterium]|jgi:hypothetical protein